MTIEALDAEAIAESLVAERVAPQVAAGCAARVDGRWRTEHGGAVGTFFDLASVTKPMTAVAVARAEAAGALDRRAPLGALLPDLAWSASGEVSLELLLAHRGGLEAHVPLFEPLARGEAFDAKGALRTAADARRADAEGTIPPAGFPAVYSDLGYLLAGVALARAIGAKDAGEAIQRLVTAPLRLDAELGTARDLEGRGIDLTRDAAPTEDVAWRGGVVR
ncbi:MAG TPA: serine hydrolase domain-containing protein, partial [Polyangiaceae bacterium]